MENNINNPNLNPSHKRQGKDTNCNSQLKTIFQYLQHNTATASMVSAATGIPQKNICRYKRDLENAGLLWETERKPCQQTGFKAWYLTTDPKQIPFNHQLKLFQS